MFLFTDQIFLYIRISGQRDFDAISSTWFIKKILSVYCIAGKFYSPFFSYHSFGFDIFAKWRKFLCIGPLYKNSAISVKSLIFHNSFCFIKKFFGHLFLINMRCTSILKNTHLKNIKINSIAILIQY